MLQAAAIQCRNPVVPNVEKPVQSVEIQQYPVQRNQQYPVQRN